MKTFYHLLVNSLVANFTNFTVWFALTFFLYLGTRSVLVTGVIAGTYLTLVAISGFWLGSLVDRFRTKAVMIISSAFSLVVYAVCFAVYLAAPEGTFTNPSNPLLWIFMVLVTVGIIAGNVRTIALSTAVTVLVPEDRRDRANGLIGTAFGITFLAVSVLSGLLVGHSGMFLVFIIALVTTSLAIAHLLVITVPGKEVPRGESASSQKVDILGTLKVVRTIPGLLALIFFTTFNNFLGGVFMGLMDAYGLSMVSVQTWGILWGILSTGFIVGGLVIAKYGLGKNPLRSLFLANIAIWSISSVFTLQQSVVLLFVGMFVYLAVAPFIEASEQTIIQKVVPHERQGRVFGFAQSVEQAASPLMAFLIGPLTQLVFIPLMTDGAGARLIGGWFGTGPSRGIALAFTLAGLVGLGVTLVAMSSKYYRQLSERYRSA